MSDRSLTLSQVLMIAVLAIVFAAIVTGFRQYASNNLLDTGRWVSTKNQLEYETMGSKLFMLERQTVHRNRLKLSAWHGYNEVSSNRVFSPKEISLRVMLSDRSHVAVIFNRDLQGYEGIRLSRLAERPSVFFRADRGNNFTTKIALPGVRIGESWHDVKLDFSSGRLEAFLDGKKLAVPKVRAKPKQFFGVRGGYSPVWIDDVVAVDAAGTVVIDENFRNDRGAGRFFGIALGATVLAVALCYGLLRLTAEPRRAGFGVSALLIVLVVTVGTASAYDYFFWSARYDYYEAFTPVKKQRPEVMQALESVRRRVFSLEPDIGKRYLTVENQKVDPFVRGGLSRWTGGDRAYPHGIHYNGPGKHQAFVYYGRKDADAFPPKKPGIVRIGYLGTSQTYGQGAERTMDRFATRLHRTMQTRYSGRTEFESFTLAIPGSQSSELAKLYAERWVNLDLDVLVVNLTYNDSFVGKLVANLRKIVELNKSRGVATLLVVEPRAPVYRANVEFLARKDEAVRGLAKKLDVPLADLAKLMSRPAIDDTGFLWWDSVHMSSAGNARAAAVLRKALIPILEGGGIVQAAADSAR